MVAARPDSDSPYESAPVLVTGASGFIGTHLCRHLNKLGANVTGVYFSNEPLGDDAEWIRLDLTDLDRVRNTIREIRPDYIFHLAGSVQGRRELDAVLPTLENNLIGTAHVMLAAQELGCCKRLVITNSQEEPGRADPQPVPASPYAASKFAASAYARMFNALYGLPVVIARVFMVYGPEQKDHNKLVPYTILRALDGKAPELSSGVRKIDWVYVSDVVEGLSRLGNVSGVEGQTIDLGTGHTYTIKAIVEKILTQIDPALEGNFGAIADRAMEQEPVANAEETRNRVGWQAKVALEEGLARTIAWYREHRLVNTLSD